MIHATRLRLLRLPSATQEVHRVPDAPWGIYLLRAVMPAMSIAAGLLPTRLPVSTTKG